MPDEKAKAILNDIRNRRMSSNLLSFKPIYCYKKWANDNKMEHTWLNHFVIKFLKAHLKCKKIKTIKITKKIKNALKLMLEKLE